MSKWPYQTPEWRRLREAKLSEQPLCEPCMRLEVIELAEVVDHIQPISKGGDPFPPLTGLMSMCIPCHNYKTSAVDNMRAGGFKRAFKGYDVDGNPIDPEGWSSLTTTPPLPPGAVQGREMHGGYPLAPSSKYIVSCEPFATGSKEAGSWV